MCALTHVYARPYTQVSSVPVRARISPYFKTHAVSRTHVYELNTHVYIRDIYMMSVLEKYTSNSIYGNKVNQ